MIHFKILSPHGAFLFSLFATFENLIKLCEVCWQHVSRCDNIISCNLAFFLAFFVYHKEQIYSTKANSIKENNISYL